MEYALGKLPAREDAILYQFSWFFSKPDLPVPPKVFGVWQHFWNIKNFQNDRIGNCVFAGAANETASWYHDIKKWVEFMDDGVISDYSAVTGYQPGNKATDKGADMGKSSEYRRKTGILDRYGRRHKIDAYVKLHKGNFDDLVLAMWLFGAVGIGVEYPDYAHRQFKSGEKWSVQKSDKIIGGHYIPGVGIDENGDIVTISWGKYQRMTRQFYEKYSDEAAGYFSVERLMNRTSPEGFQADKLISYLKDLKTPFGYSGFSLDNNEQA